MSDEMCSYCGLSRDNFADDGCECLYEVSCFHEFTWKPLTRNLAIAAALCEAFGLGYVDGYHVAQPNSYCQPVDWRPGCGRGAEP